MPQPKNQVVWTVSALNHEVKTLLERGIGRLWLEGEISNLSQPSSGHWYFSLKDDNAQIRVAMFKGKNRQVKFKAANGQQVLIQASVSLYEARGEFQVIAEHMEEAGTGKLMREYEALKAKLQREGLFDPAFKQTLPRYPKKIGIITSPTGAAIRDALSVLKRRSPWVGIIVYPCMVQGAEATQEIIQALESALTRDECDTVLMIRGGGSIEDLWCFNNEQLARIMEQSCIPIISGIGHEVDFTIADFVADFRAPTPSVAAESASIDQTELTQQLDYKSQQIVQLFDKQLKHKQRKFEQLQQQLLTLHPLHGINSQKNRLKLLQLRLLQTIQDKLHNLHYQKQYLAEKVTIEKIIHKLSQAQICKDNALQRLNQSFRSQLHNKRQVFSLAAQKLDTLSPLKTLSRGYAVVSFEGNRVIKSKGLKTNQQIDTYFSDGSIKSTIISIKPL